MSDLIDDISIELEVVLGRSHMPIHQLLRMGRGAVIELEETEFDEVRIYANNKPVGSGEIFLNGDRLAVEFTKVLTREDLKLEKY